jgi:lysophospholipase
VCIVLGGHGEFLEKYTELFGELAEHGYAGASLDWRGQGGSQRQLSDPLKAHVRDFSEYDEDLSSFLDEVVHPLSAPLPIVIAHSMGAHILLRALHAKPERFAAAVMTAPMLQTDTRGFPAWFVRVVCGAHCRAGLGGSWVWGMKQRDPLRLLFERNLVTSDRNRFARTLALLREIPDIRLAGPTWGWLEAAYRSMNCMTAPGFAEAITTPCLLFGAGRDRIVKTEAVRDFAHRLPRGTYFEIAEAKHEILMENDAVRATFWSAFDAFVAAFT